MPAKRKTYSNANKSCNRSKMDIIHSIIAKPIHKQKKRRIPKIEIKELPPLTSHVHLSDNSSLKLKTDNTFDRLLNATNYNKVSYKHFSDKNASSLFKSSIHIDNHIYSPLKLKRTKRRQNNVALEVPRSPVLTRSLSRSINSSNTTGKLKKTLERSVNESLCIEQEVKINVLEPTFHFTISDVEKTNDKKENSIPSLSYEHVFSDIFIQKYNNFNLIHGTNINPTISSTPVHSVLRQKLIDDTISPISNASLKVTPKLKKPIKTKELKITSCVNDSQNEQENICLKNYNHSSELIKEILNVDSCDTVAIYKKDRNKDLSKLWQTPIVNITNHSLLLSLQEHPKFNFGRSALISKDKRLAALSTRNPLGDLTNKKVELHSKSALVENHFTKLNMKNIPFVNITMTDIESHLSNIYCGDNESKICMSDDVRQPVVNLTNMNFEKLKSICICNSINHEREYSTSYSSESLNSVNSHQFLKSGNLDEEAEKNVQQSVSEISQVKCLNNSKRILGDGFLKDVSHKLGPYITLRNRRVFHKTIQKRHWNRSKSSASGDSEVNGTLSMTQEDLVNFNGISTTNFQDDLNISGKHEGTNSLIFLSGDSSNSTHVEIDTLNKSENISANISENREDNLKMNTAAAIGSRISFEFKGFDNSEIEESNKKVRNMYAALTAKQNERRSELGTPTRRSSKNVRNIRKSLFQTGRDLEMSQNLSPDLFDGFELSQMDHSILQGTMLDSLSFEMNSSSVISIIDSSYVGTLDKNKKCQIFSLNRYKRNRISRFEQSTAIEHTSEKSFKTPILPLIFTSATPIRVTKRRKVYYTPFKHSIVYDISNLSIAMVDEESIPIETVNEVSIRLKNLNKANASKSNEVYLENGAELHVTAKKSLQLIAAIEEKDTEPINTAMGKLGNLNPRISITETRVETKTVSAEASKIVQEELNNFLLTSLDKPHRTKVRKSASRGNAENQKTFKEVCLKTGQRLSLSTPNVNSKSETSNRRQLRKSSNQRNNPRHDSERNSLNSEIYPDSDQNGKITVEKSPALNSIGNEANLPISNETQCVENDEKTVDESQCMIGKQICRLSSNISVKSKASDVIQLSNQNNNSGNEDGKNSFKLDESVSEKIEDNSKLRVSTPKGSREMDEAPVNQELLHGSREQLCRLSPNITVQRKSPRNRGISRKKNSTNPIEHAPKENAEIDRETLDPALEKNNRLSTKASARHKSSRSRDVTEGKQSENCVERSSVKSAACPQNTFQNSVRDAERISGESTQKSCDVEFAVPAMPAIKTRENSKKNTEELVLKPGKLWRRSLMEQRNSKIGLSQKGKSPYRVIQRGDTIDTCPIRKNNIIEKTPPRRFSVRIVPLSCQQEPASKRNTTVLENYAASCRKSFFTNVLQDKSFLDECFENLSLTREKTIINLEDDPFSHPELTVTARDVVFRKCGQTEPIPFEKCYPNSILQHCQKIGEGVYGEVFLFRRPNGGTSVMKVIPIEGDLIVNGERQKKFEEILSEITIAMELSNLRNNLKNNTNGFTELYKVVCAKGKYPARLIELWELFGDTRRTENDHPEVFDEDQLYVILELANGGSDMESFVFNNAQQAHALVTQVACALAVAESSLEFEHRDLHWGNVLISHLSKRDTVSFCLNGRNVTLDTHGIQVAVIDFTLSRISYDGVCMYNDLSLDPDLFTATGDYQFDVYRSMRKQNRNEWQHFEPYSNVLWLHYLLDKAISGVRYKNKNTKIHKTYIMELIKLKDDVLEYKSAEEFVNAHFINNNVYKEMK